jgi:hypothetical protein
VKPVSASLVAVTAGLAAGAFTRWLVGVPWFWAVTFTLPVTAFTLLALLAIGVGVPNWHALPTPDSSLTDHQASALSNRFDEASRDYYRFRLRIQPRLYQLALATLRNRGLDIQSLDDDRAKLALGQELHALLTTGDVIMPSPHRLAQLLSRLEENCPEESCPVEK